MLGSFISSFVWIDAQREVGDCDRTCSGHGAFGGRQTDREVEKTETELHPFVFVGWNPVADGAADKATATASNPKDFANPVMSCILNECYRIFMIIPGLQGACCCCDADSAASYLAIVK